MNEYPSFASGRLVAGVVLVALGALWTLDNLGLANAGVILRWWPVLLVAYGVAKILGLGFSRSPIAGGVVTVFGLLLLGGSLGLAHVGIGLFWPLVLIALGVQVMRRGGVRIESHGSVEHAGERIRTWAFLGAASTRGVSQSLRSAELTAIMGGVELDLRDAKPADGRVVLDAFAFMGGIDVIVPSTWRLELEAAPIMGAIQDERVVAADLAPTGVLVVRGAVLLGGLVLRSTRAERPRVQVGVVDVRRRRRGTVVAGMRVGRVEIVHDEPRGSTGVRVGPVEFVRDEPGGTSGDAPPPPPTEPR